MKNVVKTIALAAILVASNVAAFAEEPETTASSKKSFKVGMYQTNNTTKMNLLIENPAAERLRVVLLDQSNTVLYSETIGKKDIKYWRKFEMNQLKDGVYKFEVSNGKETIRKEINLQSEAPQTAPERTIAVN